MVETLRIELKSCITTSKNHSQTWLMFNAINSAERIRPFGYLLNFITYFREKHVTIFGGFVLSTTKDTLSRNCVVLFRQPLRMHYRLQLRLITLLMRRQSSSVCFLSVDYPVETGRPHVKLNWSPQSESN